MKTCPRIVLASLILSALAACGGGGPSGNVTGVVVTPPTPSVDLGATIALTAVVQPAGASQGVTWSSSDEGVATVSSGGVVTGYGLGTSVITATSVADDDFSDSVTVSVACGTLLVISQDVDADTALPLDCYLVTRAVKVSARLSVVAGSILYFEDDAGLRVIPDGSLRAEGTALHPITFTSESGLRDDWFGVGIFSDSAANVLDHVRMENAGKTFATINGMQPTNLYVGAVTPDPLEYGRVAITNSSFGSAGKLAADPVPGTGTGLYVAWAENVLAAFEDNTFDGNGRAAMRVTSHQLGSIGAGNVFGVGAAPGAAFVEVARDGNVVASATWRALDVPYRFFHAHVVNDPAAVIAIAPGAVLEFTNQAGIRVGAGALRAIGTAAAKITFTSVSGDPG
ncbi:MAG: Ig-like domain-containing protein, partial [Trueperaceae bacterium]|nr:Ig-like domain-containing protein [Trueperaceae bacterium]